MNFALDRPQHLNPLLPFPTRCSFQYKNANNVFIARFVHGFIGAINRLERMATLSPR
jgi:hypothetical protein